MLKLISLEIRKHKLGGMLKGAVITSFAILALIVLVLFVEAKEEETSTSYPEMFDGLFVFLKAAYIIFAAVLLSRLVIDEYKNNTISLLFMYPIERKKLMAAKLIIVFGFTLAAIIVSDVVLGLILIAINETWHLVPGTLTLSMVTTELVKLGAGALYAAGISLIPLFFGMRKKSVPTTIVSAILVVSLITSGIDTVRLGNFTAVSVILGFFGIVIAYFSLRNIETEDIA
ncbi:ABC transporter permease [Paenibacillus albidus]|uniref:ABC transporter permease n=1 Tax=Paenibacillus albidus TaxID=2041023 RepID=UPI001BE6D748|nr:ABC transporter permease [Paenibacillus albidus]MBT2292041.1 ABC transporter permease [Paenibacillus albidus]